MPISLLHCVRALVSSSNENLKFDAHVSAVCKGDFFRIRALRYIRPSVSTKTAKMVACAIVSSGLDYCNPVRARMSEVNFNKFERVLHALAHVITGIPSHSRDHMTPVLAKLHWLPIRAFVSFQIVMMMFKICQIKQPSYLVELIEDAVLSRTLQSSTCRQGTLRESKMCWSLLRELSTTLHPKCGTLCQTILGALEAFRSQYTFVQTHICLLFPCS